MKHDLKIWPKYIREIIFGIKTFEVRKNDRGYQVGDILHLKEFDTDRNEYTGDSIYRKVTYILDDPQYVKEGFVIMSLGRVPIEEIKRLESNSA